MRDYVILILCVTAIGLCFAFMLGSVPGRYELLPNATQFYTFVSCVFALIVLIPLTALHMVRMYDKEKEK